VGERPSERASGRGERTLLDLAREWWWGALIAVVALSIGVSSLGGSASRDRAGRRDAVVAVSPTVDPATLVLHDVAHRLVVGHRRPLPFDFDRCAQAHPGLGARQVHTFCLARAHLNPTPATPFTSGG